GKREADEQRRRGRTAVTVIDLGDAAASERLAESQKAPLWLGNLDGDQRFALPADVGALRDVTQTVEIHVRAAVHGDEGLVAALLARNVALDSRDRQCACGLDDRAIVFEDVLDRGTNLVRAHRDHLIDDLAGDAEGLFSHTAY